MAIHVHQPCPPDMFEVDPFQKIPQEWTAISAGTEEKSNTMTASWGGFGTIWDRRTVFVFVRESRYTKEFMDGQRGFSLSFFEKKYHSMLKYFGSVSGRDEDKMKNARMVFSYYKGVPYINEANLVLICKKLAAVPMPKETISLPVVDQMFYEHGDYHTMYVGEITMVLAR